MSDTSLQLTPLHANHQDLGARLVPFAGWEMPVQYVGVMEEHRAVRSAAGVFDVSHMGQVRSAGPGALDFLQRATSNDVSRIPVGGAQYSLLCAEDGGVLDDLFTYRLATDVFLTVTNAGNHPADFERLAGIASDEGFDVEVTDEAASTAMLAVQGPKARGIVEALADAPLPDRMTASSATIAGHKVLVAGTGYTGEDGVELLMALDAAVPVWEAVVAAGAVPCGLGSRDTLRLEACYHLYGNDLDPSRNPIEAGLGWACKEDTGFIGSDAIAAARSKGTPEVLVAFEITGAGIARTGNPVVGGGVVSSGTFSPTFEKAIGMAYLPAESAIVGADFQIDVRGKQRAAIVLERPIYRKG